MVVADYHAIVDESVAEDLCLYWHIGTYGPLNAFLSIIGVGRRQILFTDFSFIFVAVYIFIPFMILPIFSALEELNPSFIAAAYDLGASA